MPYQIYRDQTVKTAAADGFEVRREELDWSAIDPGTRTEFDKIFGENKSIVIDPLVLERRFTIPERNRPWCGNTGRCWSRAIGTGKGLSANPSLARRLSLP